MKTLSILIVFLSCFNVLAQAQWKPVATLPTEPFVDLYSTGGVLYAAGTHRVYYSKDGGLSWSASSLINAEDDEVSDLLVIDSTIYAAMLLNGCYVSTDHGRSWKQHNTGLSGLGATNLSSLAIRKDKIYLGTLGSGVFVKPLKEPFAPWQAFNHDIPWVGIQSLYTDGDQLLAGAGGSATLARNVGGSSQWTEHPFDGSNGELNIFLSAMREGTVLYGAGSQGLYRSVDNGTTWTAFNPGVGFIERARLTSWQGAPVALLVKSNSSTYLRVSNNQGQTWSAFQPAFPKKTWGFDLQTHGGKLFYAASDGLWVLSTTVPTRDPILAGFSLGQNNPNPTNGTTTHIPFVLEHGGNVRLSLCDLLGRIVYQRDLGKLGAGKHESTIDLSSLSKGIYVYTLNVDGKILSRKMVVQ